MSMAVIVPTRGRPDNARRLIDAWTETRADLGAHLYLCVDGDERDLYADLPVDDDHVSLVVGPDRRRLGPWLNAMAVDVDDEQHGYQVIGFMGDDHLPRTADWVDRILEAMVPGGVVYGNDLIQGAALPTAVFMDARIIRTLGWFVLPGMTHLFMDNLWKTLGEQLGTLRYLPDVIIEHVHPIAGKAEWDAGYREANDGAVWEHDEAIYREWVAFQMPADIARIKAAL